VYSKGKNIVRQKKNPSILKSAEYVILKRIVLGQQRGQSPPSDWFKESL
jgi:hypothetical protein